MAEYILHRTIAGERWDGLALQYYRDVSRQSALIAANRHLWPDLSVPAILPPGLELQVPLLEAPQADTQIGLPPWKR